MFGGRWNSLGRRFIYAARTFAGAMLEVLVHTNTGWFPTQHVYIEIRIPANIRIECLDVIEVPGWDEAHDTASRAFGDDWYDSQRSAVLIVPSIVVS